MSEKNDPKIQIQKEYNEIIPQLGDRVYRLLMPYYEISEMIFKLIRLNKKFSEILQSEKKPELKAVPDEKKPE